MPAIKQPLANITRPDIDRMIQDAWPEDEELEFKQEIPGRGGRPDRWYRDQSGIDEYGRNQVLAEVVALANTYGGDVVIGIVESHDKPARAVDLKFVPQPAELAHRLELAARDCIEPSIPLLQARGIVLTEDDSGVVVIRVPRSRHAPHRLRPTLQSYRRVRDRTEQMSMREIQDLTFSVARGLEGVDRKLREIQQRFYAECDVSHVPADTLRLGLNVRAVPASADLYIERVHNIEAIAPAARTFTITFNGENHHQVQPLHRIGTYRPILRGTRAVDARQTFDCWLELLCDGSLSSTYRLDNPDREPEFGQRREHVVYPSWLLSLVLNSADTADRFRTFAGAGAVEYALEVEIVSRPKDVPTFGLGSQFYFDEAGRFPAGFTALPRYGLWGPDTRVPFLDLFWRDYWNAAGTDVGADRVTGIA